MGLSHDIMDAIKYLWLITYFIKRFKVRLLDDINGEDTLMLYSYDVFDTLITRITSSPKGVFYLLEDKIKRIYNSKNWCVNFADVRMNAEKNAYLKYGNNVSIDKIYNVLSNMLCVEDSLLDAIKQEELNLEYICSVPIKDRIEEIKELIEAGEHVVLISDMYLSSDFIRDLLTKHSDIFKNVPIYVSNEAGVTKSEGLLYKYVKEKEKACYFEWVHCGDNRQSDVNIPHLLGITTRIIEECKIDNIAYATINSIDMSDEISKQIYSKLVTSKMESAEYGIGFCQGGPILYEYVCWILGMCKKIGKNRLFFIARDGYILKIIADIIIQSKRLDVYTSYLFGSRKAWRVDDEKKRELVREYISQELDDDYNNIAFIDMQGTGKSCDYVSDITGHSFPVFVYFFVGGNKNSKCTTYIYSYNNDKIGIMECLCRAPHGATYGYKREGKRVCPIIEDEGNTEETYSAIDRYCRGVYDFVSEICKVDNILGTEISFKNISYEILKKINNTPNEETATFLGELVHSGDNDDRKKYAPILKENDILPIVNDISKYNGANLNLSLVRSNDSVKKLYNEVYSALMRAEPKRNKFSCKYKVILYGAGKNGRQMFIKYNESESIEIVAWVDLKFESLAKEGFHVQDPIIVRDSDKYDYVVIGIKTNTEIVKRYLVEAGVPSGKIITADEMTQLL